MFQKKLYLFIGLLMLGGVISVQPVAVAAEYTIKKMTSQVTSALEGRRNRYESLKALKEQRKIGENNRGYVKAFVDEDQVQMLVSAENSDRKVIYETIALQNNINDAIATIETVFAKTQRDKASPGEKIQLEDGGWTTK